MDSKELAHTKRDLRERAIERGLLKRGTAAFELSAFELLELLSKENEMDSKKDRYDRAIESSLETTGVRPADLAAVEAYGPEEMRAHAINFAISRGLLEDSLAVRNYSIDELYDHVLQADSMETERSEKSFELSTYDGRLRDQFTEFARRPLNLNEYWSAPSGEGPKGAAWENKPHRLLYDLIGEVVRLTEHLLDQRGEG